jgi:TolB-like protein/tetratricopeptide (TPR) repeat protein
MSADGDQAYLADGIAEEILNTLAGIREIRVPARTSSFHFRGRDRPIREIARELGVEAILEGSVRKMGNRIRITAQLIDARVDRHLWSNTFEAELDDIFAVQTEIAATVSEALRVEFALSGGGTGRPPTTSMAAYDLYLRGLSHWNRRSAPDLVLAIRFFDEATELDPDFARAWAGLALVHAVLPIGFTPPLPTEVARARLEEVADRALALDSTLAEVHAARGLSYHFAWRWDDAEREFRRALALNPRYATAHQWYGEHQAKLGRAAEGVASMRRALELDPLSLVIRNDLGLVLLLNRQMSEARAAWEETVAMDPSFSIPHYFLHRHGIMEGDLEAAEEAGRRWVALTGAVGNSDILTLTRAMGDADLRPDAFAILERWEAGETPRWLDIAFYRLYLGDREGALTALERAVRAGAPMVAQIGHSPWMDPLRGEARFEALVRELGFSQARMVP